MERRESSKRMRTKSVKFKYVKWNTYTHIRHHTLMKPNQHKKRRVENPFLNYLLYGWITTKWSSGSKAHGKCKLFYCAKGIEKITLNDFIFHFSM